MLYRLTVGPGNVRGGDRAARYAWHHRRAVHPSKPTIV
jgi:hypothetical protein